MYLFLISCAWFDVCRLFLGGALFIVCSLFVGVCCVLFVVVCWLLVVVC